MSDEIDLRADFESRFRVKNEFPVVDVDTVPYRIAIVGEAPGADEEQMERPFVGASGFFLDNLLSNVGILRSACFLGNLCQIRPPGNDLKRFNWEGTELVTGRYELRQDLKKFNPNIVILLGQWPLFAAMGPNYDISDYRGSLFVCDEDNSPFNGFKCIATYHPANCLRDYSHTPLFKLDLARARAQGESSELILPQRKINIELSAHEAVYMLRNWPEGKLMSTDIEGGIEHWSMISFAAETLSAFTIAWSKYTLEEHCMVLREVCRVLRNPAIPKLLQNGMYDAFVLGYRYKIFVAGLVEDTMLKGHEIYAELPKGLDTQASIWTLQPQWKHLIAYSKKERKKRQVAGVDAGEEHHNKMIACGIDSSVTMEICQAQQRVLDGGKPGPGSLSHYQFNINLLAPFRYMEHRGIRYDIQGAVDMLVETQHKISEAQTRLNLRVGKPLNMASPKQVAEFLYVQKGLEKQYVKEHGRKTEKVTTDVGALLTLVRKYDTPYLHDMLLIRRLSKRSQSLSIGTDPDGRVRCGYNIVGADTTRISCYTSPTGSGENLQTVTKKHRRLYLADLERFFFQCDLEGADGWTVAARCAALGDDTMLQDYYYGIKPARVIALMYEHGIEVGSYDRETLKRLGKTVDGDGWLYFGSKRIQHGTNYELGPVTMSDQILKDSYKYLDTAIFVPTNKCKQLQGLYVEGRYGKTKPNGEPGGINAWKAWARSEMLAMKPGGLRLTTASGHTRIFFNRRRNGKEVAHETLRQFLSHEPQANTTYATNLAMSNLWSDRANRVSSYYGVGSSDFIRQIQETVSDAMSIVESHAARLKVRDTTEGGFLIEPQHQVHDALNGQFDKALLPWAKTKIKSYFNNALTIAGRQIVIPYDGGYGPSWGECGDKFDKEGNLVSDPNERGKL